MKYLGEEKVVEVKTQVERPVLYVKCNKCKKIIKPDRYKSRDNRYVYIHTWHSDWGNDSIESHEYKDYCPECAKEVVADYIADAEGTEELELSIEHLYSGEKFRGRFSVLDEDRYVLANTGQEV